MWLMRKLCLFKIKMFYKIHVQSVFGLFFVCYFFFLHLFSLCMCVYLCSCGYTGVMRARRRVLLQGTTPQLDAPHSIWLTLLLRSHFKPLILSHLHFSNTLPLLSSSQVKTDCSSTGTNLTVRLLLNEPWRAARIGKECKDVKEKAQRGEKKI